MQETARRIYKPDNADYVSMEWHGYHNSVSFREGTERMLGELKLNKTGKVLADIRHMVLIGMEDQDWLLNDFLPRAISQGFEAIAIVRPEAYFNKVAVETIAYRVNQEQLSIKFFDDIQQAREWLENFRKKEVAKQK